LGLAAGRQVEQEPYNLLLGKRKGPDGQKLGRAPANAGKAVEIYKGLVAAEPGARVITATVSCGSTPSPPMPLVAGTHRRAR
jgi:hypothetical protein